MSKTKKALLIGTKYATSTQESGASLRFFTIRTLVSSSGYDVTAVNKSGARKALQESWDLIVLVSFSTARFLIPARKRTSKLWFDSTDSIILSRISLLKCGKLLQIPLMTRDLFWTLFSPKVELLTYITKRDANKDKILWSKYQYTLILPVLYLNRKIYQGSAPRIVFIGDGKYYPNLKSLSFLKSVHAKLPAGSIIHIYGQELKNDYEGFLIHGYEKRENLYFQDDIHLVPIKYGSGLKLKAAIPLWNGLTVVSTKEGASGFSNLPNLVVADRVREFAFEISKLLHRGKGKKILLKQELIYQNNDTKQIKRWLES